MRLTYNESASVVVWIKSRREEIRHMTYRKLAEALKADTGIVCGHSTLRSICKELGVVTNIPRELAPRNNMNDTHSALASLARVAKKIVHECGIQLDDTEAANLSRIIARTNKLVVTPEQ